MTRPRMLLIDDEDPILFAMSDYFEGRGYRVDCAHDRAEAAARLLQRRYSIVITDLRLERDDSLEGLDIAETIHQCHPDTHCIVLTAYGSPETEQAALKRGVSSVLQKPIALSKIETAVRALVPPERVTDPPPSSV